jgi:hypothetical protein
MFFIKSLAGGIAAAIVAWAFVVALEMWRIARVYQKMQPGPLRAVAFEWGYFLLQKPWVIGFLTISFGLGLWLTSHYLARQQAIL